MQFPVGITQAAVLYKTSYAGQYGKQESESQSAQAPAQFVPRRFPYEAQQPAYWPGHAFSETTQSGDGEETPRAEQAQRAVPHQDAAQADPSGKTEAARMAASHRLPVLRGHLGDPHLPGAERLDEGGDQRVQRDDHPAVRQQRGAPPRPRVFSEGRRRRTMPHRLFEHLPGDRRHLHAVLLRTEQHGDLLGVCGRGLGHRIAWHVRASDLPGGPRLAVHHRLHCARTRPDHNHLAVLEIPVHRALCPPFS